MDVERFLDEAQRDAANAADRDTGHPSDASLWAYAGEQLSRNTRRRLDAHLGRCESCRERLATLEAEIADVERQLAPHLETSQVQASDRRSSLWDALRALFGPQPKRLARHAAAFVVIGAALVGLNAGLNAAFAPEPSPFVSPKPPPWFARWWAPYVIGVWAVVLAIHAIIIWQHRR